MRRSRIFVFVSGGLFVAWLCWLGYLAATKTNPVIVSRSQVMASTHFVVATVTIDPQSGQPDRDVTVVDDLRPVGESLKGKKIRVENIRNGRIGGARSFDEKTAYLMPLRATPSGFMLTLQPPSPGQEHIDYQRVQPWVYVWDAPGVQQQFEALVPNR
jgi:hypothetical protein